MCTRYIIHILNHNYNPGPILECLTHQITSRAENIKIILWDDGSDPSYRNAFPGLQSKYRHAFITWQLKKINTGRAAMRQKILEHTQDGWMISIDSDMMPDTDFIDRMISSLQDTGTVYTGYHYYQDDAPADDYLLHWNYGRRREVLAQKKDPYLHFSTGIYAIHASLTNNLYFDDSIQTYGHEDTLFGLLLQEKKIPVRITSIKALHQGLSTNDAFITKQLESARNLKVVLSHYPAYKSHLIQWAQRIDKLPGATKWLSKGWVRQWCIKSLHRNPDGLIYLDVMKLNELM